MASAALSWHQMWHAPARVQEIAPPGRKGTIRATSGTGPNAQITVALDGRPAVTLRQSQLILI